MAQKHDKKLAVRRGDEKLVVLDGQSSLFDLAADLEESIDVASSDPDTVAELTALFEHWNVIRTLERVQ